MTLIRDVERCLRDGGISAARFGREAVGDPRLVFDMRRGRELRPATAERVRAYVDRIGKGKPTCE
jgi:2,4-dienoyl-CoA reductase-like NADH-dependent reductase (Old Yellow Enzyme family)